MFKYTPPITYTINTVPQIVLPNLQYYKLCDINPVTEAKYSSGLDLLLTTS